MIKTMTMYTVCCDGCGTSADEDGDYAAWGDQNTAEESALATGYVEVRSPAPEQPSSWWCEECADKPEPPSDTQQTYSK